MPACGLWILKTYVEPTNKAIEASAQRWAQKHGATVSVEYFTFEDMQTKYVAAIENKNTPDVGQLETGAPARFAGMGQLLDLTAFARQIEGQVGKPPANVAPVSMVGGAQYAIPWYIMAAFWYVWRDVFEKSKVKLPSTFEEAKNAAKTLNRPAENFFGMGQSWNRTADGYGVMQSLMYSYGVGWATREGKYRSLKTPGMQQVMKWATDIYKEGIQPADTLSWTGSQNNENFIAKKIAQTSNGAQHHVRPRECPGQGHRRQGTQATGGSSRQSSGASAPGGPDGRRMWAIAMSFSIFKSTKDPDSAMSLVAHLLSPEETLTVMRDSYGQFAPVLDKARAAARDYFNKNENYRNFGRAAEWFVATGWPGPVTAAAAEVQASNVLTDAPAGHRRQGLDRVGYRLGRQEDQGDLRHAGCGLISVQAPTETRPFRVARAGVTARGRRRGRDLPTAVLLLLPLLVLVGGLIIYPFGRALWLSLTDKLVGYPERFVGLRNYIYLIHDDNFRQVVRNSLIFTVASVGLKVLSGLAMALVLSGIWRWRNVFRGLFLLPWITSTVIVALTWRWMFDAFPGRGFFNSALSMPGSSPAPWPSWPPRRARCWPSSWPTGGAASPSSGSPIWPACRPSPSSSTRRPRWTGRAPGGGSGTSRCPD